MDEHKTDKWQKGENSLKGKTETIYKYNGYIFII
jgi:hypothetical protein